MKAFTVFSERGAIKGVAERWRRQYREYHPDHSLGDGSKVGAIQAALDNLDKNTATSAQVKKIIGNDGWTKLFCGGCSKYKTKGVIFNNYGSEGHSICLTCIERACKAAR